MNIKYFPDTDTAIVEFSGGKIEETREVSENVYLDMDKNGNLVSMTVEHAREYAHFPNISFTQIEKQKITA